MGRRCSVSPELLQKAVQMRRERVPFKVIVHELGISRTTLSRILKKAQLTRPRRTRKDVGVGHVRYRVEIAVSIPYDDLGRLIGDPAEVQKYLVQAVTNHRLTYPSDHPVRAVSFATGQIYRVAENREEAAVRQSIDGAPKRRNKI